MFEEQTERAREDSAGLHCGRGYVFCRALDRSGEHARETFRRSFVAAGPNYQSHCCEVLSSEARLSNQPGPFPYFAFRNRSDTRRLANRSYDHSDSIGNCAGRDLFQETAGLGGWRRLSFLASAAGHCRNSFLSICDLRGGPRTIFVFAIRGSRNAVRNVFRVRAPSLEIFLGGVGGSSSWDSRMPQPLTAGALP